MLARCRGYRLVLLIAQTAQFRLVERIPVRITDDDGHDGFRLPSGKRLQRGDPLE